MIQNLFQSKILKILMIFILSITFSNCNTYQNPIPYEYIDVTIDLNKPEFFDLHAIGNYVYITGGYKGIIVYRNSTDEFSAYERTCTYNLDCRVSVDENGYNLIDTCCGSEFSLTMDGEVVKGPASIPLRKYQTIFYPNNNSLRIMN